MAITMSPYGLQHQKNAFNSVPQHDYLTAQSDKWVMKIQFANKHLNFSTIEETMSKFLNGLALLPMSSFIVTMIYILMVKGEIYTNHYWFVVALVSLQSTANRLKSVNSVCIIIFVSSILANILLLIACGFDLKITPTTIGLFLGYLSFGLLIVYGNLAINWYKRLSNNKAL